MGVRLFVRAILPSSAREGTLVRGELPRRGPRLGFGALMHHWRLGGRPEAGTLLSQTMGLVAVIVGLFPGVRAAREGALEVRGIDLGFRGSNQRNSGTACKFR